MSGQIKSLKEIMGTEIRFPSMCDELKKAVCESCGNIKIVTHHEPSNKTICLDCIHKFNAMQEKNNGAVYSINKLKLYCKIPKKYIDKTFENFKGGEKYINELKFHLREEPIESIFMTGVCGCGKSHLAAASIRYLFEQGKDPNKMIFLSACELLLMIRGTFHRSGNDPTEEDIMKKYTEIPILVLDDLGATEISEWGKMNVYILLDRRYREMLPTIVTSNMDLAEIESDLGARIASRLSEGKVIQIDLPDYRKKRKGAV